MKRKEFCHSDSISFFFEKDIQMLRLIHMPIKLRIMQAFFPPVKFHESEI